MMRLLFVAACSGCEHLHSSSILRQQGGCLYAQPISRSKWKHPQKRKLQTGLQNSEAPPNGEVNDVLLHVAGSIACQVSAQEGLRMNSRSSV